MSKNTPSPSDQRLASQWEYELERMRSEQAQQRGAGLYGQGLMGQPMYPSTNPYSYGTQIDTRAYQSISASALEPTISVEMITDVSRMSKVMKVGVLGERIRLEFPFDADMEAFRHKAMNLRRSSERPMCAILEILQLAKECGANVSDVAIDHYSAEAMAEEIKR